MPLFTYGAFSSPKELKRFVPYFLNFGTHQIHGYKSGYFMVAKDGIHTTYGLVKDKDSKCRGRIYFIPKKYILILDKVEGTERYKRVKIKIWPFLVWTYKPINPDLLLKPNPTEKYQMIIKSLNA